MLKYLANAFFFTRLFFFIGLISMKPTDLIMCSAVPQCLISFELVIIVCALVCDIDSLPSLFAQVCVHKCMLMSLPLLLRNKQSIKQTCYWKMSNLEKKASTL